MNKYLIYNGSKLFYRVTGNGKPVILIHGFGEDGDVWDNQVNYLKNKFQLIVPDLPGSGKSSMIDDMSMEGMAEVIHAIIHEENIDTCPIIGHSMGGYITLAFVEKYFNHVSGFSLFHSSAFADSEEKKKARRQGMEAINEKGPAEFLKTATPKLFSPRSVAEKPELIAKQVALADNFLAPALVSYYDAMMNRPDRTALLTQSTVPVQFILGKYDTAIPIEDGLKQCHLPGKSYIHILQQSGHMGMLEEAEKSNSLLELFLLAI